ncbi:class I SAM-dependent methyltransferase [Xanthomonas sacchari]|uniref:class I SAM-dependent methyltransferase n=1 Tax=Xanthomonas sacchari TaxID=56458 RepID=UPI0005823A1E|nr:methyltransferase domain-containing protein [Xanthomonas sacchari]AJC44758.1 biotin synthase [Xanthomonas sacchari]
MSAVPTLDPLTAYALWADSYPAQAHNPVMQAEQRAMLALLPPSLYGQHVLDAGCGSGRYLLHALQRGAGHVTGVDLSPQMLARAAQELGDVDTGRYALHEGRLEALPLADASADLSLCALALGHLPQLPLALAELRRVTRPGGWVLCSDVHPIGPALGWRRDFKAGGQRYAVRHTQHLYSHWHAACAALGLAIDAVSEPMLDPADIPAGAHFDPAALQVPVALVLRLRRLP